jgi:asparagine synthase (glutamine-hydrolysing)
MGFPIHDLFDADHEAVETWFTEEKLARTAYVDAERARELRDAHRRGEEQAGWTLWSLLTYVAWYHTFVDEEHRVV